jgi:replicative DNA helicase
VLNLIRAWCEGGVKVAYNSLDMAVKPMLKRPVGELSRVSFAKASFGTTTKADLEAIHEAIHGVRDSAGELVKKGVMQWPLTLIQERDVDVFRSWCLAMRQMGKIDVVIVDFVQLMGTKSRYSNDNEKLEYVSGVLKSIAIDLEIPVIALSQLNRACEDDGGRVPTASDLRGSGALEQDATAV